MDAFLFYFFRQDSQDSQDFFFFVSRGNKEYPIACSEVAKGKLVILESFFPPQVDCLPSEI